jgi:hypothetical protein
MATAPRPLGGPLALPPEAIHVTGRRILATSTDGLGSGFASYLIVLVLGESGSAGRPADFVAGLPVLAGVADGTFAVACCQALGGDR